MPEQPLALDQINAEIVRELLRDLVIECTNNTQVVIKQDSRAGSDDGQAILHAASDLTLDITTSGKNGLDTGAEASDTWYYIWMIYNPGTQETAGLLSASSSSPTLPSGFTKKRLVGAVRNNGSSNFRQFLQTDTDVDYFEQETLLSAGSATSYTALSLASMMPTSLSPTASINGKAGTSGGSGTGVVSRVSLDGTNKYVQLNVAASASSGNAMNVGGSLGPVPQRNGQLYYVVSDSNDYLDLYVRGFTLNL